MENGILQASVLHWNYRGFTRFPIELLDGDEDEVTDIYLKENLISEIPADVGKLVHLESLYLSGNDIVELPREISRLQCLKCLDVSGNRLRNIPDEIGEVRGLKFLLLDENELTELPLRLVELKQLRYLSVCDNKLQWLPQRPVYNYHHCEFRFWRNTTLKTIPYSLWYHMLRGQQTRCLTIGCLTFPKCLISPGNGHKRSCRLNFTRDSREWSFDVQCPPNVIMGSSQASPPSLFEMCSRIFYQMLSDTAVKLSKEHIFSYDDNRYRNENDEANIVNLGENFQQFNIEIQNQNCDVNGNDLCPMTPTFNKQTYTKKTLNHYSPADVIEEYYSFLPKFLKRDLRNGPISRCENVSCKKPIFEFAVYEFCFGKITLIDNLEDIILSAALCSKRCADDWKKGKSVIPWDLV